MNTVIETDAMRHYARLGDFEYVSITLQAGADVHARDDEALQLAAENGHTDVVDLLLKSGAYVHARDNWALRTAADNGHLEVVDLLLKSGADVHADGDGALRWAAYKCHKEVIDLLLKAGADITGLHQSDIMFEIDLTAKQITDLLKQHATHAYRGYEAVMMLDNKPGLAVLRHLYPNLKLKHIREQLALMKAMGLSPAHMAAMWKAQHSLSQTQDSIGPT